MIAAIASWNLPAPKRLLFLGTILVIVATSFWMGSRYPEIDEKALMGENTMLEDPLGFQALLQVEDWNPLWQRVTYSTINWIDTNKRGMTFGIFLGAILLTLVKMLRRRSYSSAVGNTLLGIIMGAPLGVCVNCAAPVAKGLHHAGARLETTLATMISSPTLNVVILTMLFALFPPYLAITKLVATLVFILVIIPVMSRYVFADEVRQTIENEACLLPELDDFPDNEGWQAAFVEAGKDLLGNLWFIVRTTMPLMLLAGFLGALVVSLMPLETIAALDTGITTMLLLALVGIFLPVPMAFDVIICAILLAAGMPVAHVMVLLFTLGIFSVYSFFIVATTISKRVAFGLVGVLMATGIITGYIAGQYHDWELDRMLEMYRQSSSIDFIGSANAAETQEQVAVGVGIPAESEEWEAGGVDVTSVDFQPRSPGGEKLFTRYETQAFGIDMPILFSGKDFWSPFFHERGVASGDFDNDGWVDILLGSELGVHLYRNREGQGFEGGLLNVPGVAGLNTFVVAFIDINNDGWLDIYFTAYNQGNYYALNQQGDFANSTLVKIENAGAVHTQSLTFGDIDSDGDLDGILGNWYYGNGGPRPLVHDALNKILINKNGAFSDADMIYLDGLPGETLSALLSDFNQDGHLDLIIGNDFKEPDYYYFGDGAGGFRKILKQDDIIPRTTTTTMSIDTADVNNDLTLEVYVTQIAARATGASAQIYRRPFDDYCLEVAEEEDRVICERNVEIREAFQLKPSDPPTDIEKCDTIAGKYEGQRDVCRAMWLMQMARTEKKRELCDMIDPAQERAAFICRNSLRRGRTASIEEKSSLITQIRNDNVFLVRGEDGRFTDEAEAFGLQTTAWSWTGKFADVNNDTWQDVLVVNGTWWTRPGLGVTSNMFFVNNQGVKFEEKTAEFGLEDFAVVSAYTYFDMDNDGDLDILTNAVNARHRLYINNETENNSIAFNLRDHIGNRFGIGSKIIIHYGENGSLHQIREIKSGGGYQSFDAPIAYFGLGKHEDVQRIEVQWSTGGATEIDGPFNAGAKHTITRRG